MDLVQQPSSFPEEMAANCRATEDFLPRAIFSLLVDNKFMLIAELKGACLSNNFLGNSLYSSFFEAVLNPEGRRRNSFEGGQLTHLIDHYVACGFVSGQALRGNLLAADSSNRLVPDKKRERGSIRPQRKNFLRGKFPFIKETEAGIEI